MELPVVVFIHAGGYGISFHILLCALIDHFFKDMTRSASLYPQADLVTDSQNRAIAVFIQYRLGAFGNVCSTIPVPWLLKALKASWLVPL
jgi:hypothetical protein